MTDAPQPNEAVKVFYSYAHEDEDLRKRLDQHFSFLKREKKIAAWCDGEIEAGKEWRGEIEARLNAADVILLLISAAFADSDFCYSIEMTRAMERHDAGEAVVVPILLQPCDWQGAPFAKLQALPSGEAISLWPNVEQALYAVAKGVREIVEDLIAKRAASPRPSQAEEKTRPAATSNATVSLIPRPPSIGFVARRDEQGDDIFVLLKNALAPGKSELVAVSGPGGTGKTTLAAEVARSLRGDYAQRLAWVSALGRTDFGLQTLLDDIATQLGRADLRRLAPDQKAEQVRALLADAPSLVVLDNFETIEPGEQARCAAFLAESTECSALITTRERVNRADVRNVRLAAMEMGDAREFWRRLVEQSGRPEAFDGLDADEIIRHCEANPLVIQWVVGQIELAQRPKDALAYLSEGKGDAAERVFDRSFNLPQLGDDGRAALLALSLFTPDASRESLAEVAGFGDDLNRLNEAVRRMSALWLVETTEGHERLFLRALKHEMAKSRLSRDARADEFRRRYVRYFLRYTQAHKQPTPENIDALEAEKDNLRGAMDVAFGLQDFRSVIGIEEGLRHLLRLRGYWDEAIKSGKQAEEAARRSNDDLHAAAVLGNVAIIRIERGEYEEAEVIYRRALEIFRRLGSEENVAVALHELGVIAQHQGELERARQYYDDSLEISKRIDDQIGIASTTGQIGALLLAQGDFEQSKAKHEESLAINRKLGEYEGMAFDLKQLGSIALARKDFAEARRLLSESLELSGYLGDQVGIASASRNLGVLAELEGDKAEAARLYREASRIYEVVSSPQAVIMRGMLARLGGEDSLS